MNLEPIPKTKNQNQILKVTYVDVLANVNVAELNQKFWKLLQKFKVGMQKFKVDAHKLRAALCKNYLWMVYFNPWNHQKHQLSDPLSHYNQGNQMY